MSPAIVAHRGGALLWPENSLAAIHGALALGADGVDVDVHLTRDGRVVVHHDARLGRTVVGEGRIRDLEHAVLTNLPLVAEPTGRIPLLDDVARMFASEHALLSVEIKNGATGSPYPRVVEAVLGSLAPLTDKSRLLVHAFDWRTLERLHRADPNIATAANIEKRTVKRYGGLEETIAAARARGFDHINIDHRMIDERARDAARDAGMLITTWTVNRDVDITRMMELGVDYIATDVPNHAIEMRRARSTAASDAPQTGLTVNRRTRVPL